MTYPSSAQSMAASGYAGATRSVGTPRAIEYQAFQRVTAMLHAAAVEDTPFAKVAEAVHMNSRLWAALAQDLASSGNTLPDELRAKLFELAEFSRRYGLQVLSGAVTPAEGLADLQNINTAIMRGLRGDASAPAETGA